MPRLWPLWCGIFLVACTERALRIGDQPPVSVGDLAVGASDLATSDLTSVDLTTPPDLTQSCPSPEEPSRQTVTFQIVNHATTERYVVTSGQFCDAYSVDGLSLALGFQCGCECPSLGAPYAATFKRVSPGASIVLTWDARALSTCPRELDCHPGATTVLSGALKPTPAGAYRVHFAQEDAPPMGCSSSGDNVICGPNNGGPPPPSIQTICPARSMVVVDFTLPASGDIAVSVPLS